MRKNAIWAVSIILATAMSARADYVSQTFQFDLSDSLPMGLSFGSATIEAYDGVGPTQNGLGGGMVRMTFHAYPLVDYGPVGAKFGFEQVGFNSKLALSDTQIQIPAGWSLRQNRFMGSWGGFGLFGWQAFGDPAALNGPLSITINDLGADAKLENFLVGSKNSLGELPLNGSVHFAGRIGGFDLNDDFFDLTSHVTAVSVLPAPIELDDPNPETGGGLEEPPVMAVQNPEPATWLMGIVGVGAIGVRRWWRKHST